MRIALVTDGISPLAIGGMQTYSTNLARHLAEQGVQVDLYFPARDGDATREICSPASFPSLAIGSWRSSSLARRSSNTVVTGSLAWIVVGLRPFDDVGDIGRCQCRSVYNGDMTQLAGHPGHHPSRPFPASSSACA